MQAELKIVKQAATGDFTGLNFFGLARMSFEPDHDKERPKIPITGADFSNREEHDRVNREYVEGRGGTYLGTIDEPHTSAWKKQRVALPDGTYAYRVVRPKYEQALSDLRRGLCTCLSNVPEGTPVHGFVFPRDDRLTRDPRHLEDAIEVVEYYDKPIIDVKGDLDLLTKNGRQMARIRVTMLKDQSDSASERGKDSHYARALRGIPAGGQRPFGWKADKRARKKSEARLLKETVDWILADVGIQSIEKRWFERGIRGINGQPFERRTIKNMMLNPRIAGIRKYRQAGRPLWEHYLLDAEGKHVMGQHEPIITVKTWLAVVDKLTNPGRPGAGVDVGKLKYLGSTVLRCGECGGLLSGQAKENNRYDYACKNIGCGKVAGSGIVIDQKLTEYAHAYLANQQVTLKPAKWSRADELKDLEEEKRELLDQFRDNSDMGNYIWPQIRELDKKIKELVKERTKHTQQRAKVQNTDIATRWPDLETEQQRAIFEEVFEVVILSRASKPSNRFDPARLEYVVRKSLSLARLGYLLQGKQNRAPYN